MSQSGLGPGGRLGIPPLRLPDAGGHAAAPRPRPATLPIPGIGRAGALPRLTRAAWLTPRGTQASPASWPGHVHAREGEQLCIATHSRFVRAVSPRSVPHALRRLRAATLRRGRRRRLETTADSEVGRTGWPRGSPACQGRDVLLTALAECAPEVGHHSTGVGHLAESTAYRLGLERDQQVEVRLAGELHDVGKVAIPNGILSKPGGLTREERLVVEQHPVIESPTGRTDARWMPRRRSRSSNARRASSSRPTSSFWSARRSPRPRGECPGSARSRTGPGATLRRPRGRLDRPPPGSRAKATSGNQARRHRRGPRPWRTAPDSGAPRSRDLSHTSVTPAVSRLRHRRRSHVNHREPSVRAADER